MEGNRFRLDKGPKRHHTRPAVDTLFESAARAFGPRVAGLLLSGGGTDDVNGLIAVRRASGVSLAQDPADAKNPSMPIQAICEDDVAAVLPLARLADAIVALATEGVLEGSLSANEGREARRD